jgi:hypothetical protein
MELPDQNKDDILNIISKGIEQEMLLQVAKEQLGLRNGADILLFLSFYDGKYTKSMVADGRKYWSLSDGGKEFLRKGGFSGLDELNKKEKKLFYGIIIALIIVVALFIWSETRIL